jgi:hypothetical protein
VDLVEILREALEKEKKFEEIFRVHNISSFFQDNFGFVQFKPKNKNKPKLEIYKGNYESNIERKEMKMKNARGFILENFFSSLECQFYISQLEEIGFKSVNSEYPSSYRNNERLIIYSNELSGKMTEKLFPMMNQKDIEYVSPIGFGSEGIWKPIRVNECFKFSKYRSGQKFEAHRGSNLI